MPIPFISPYLSARQIRLLGALLGVSVALNIFLWYVALYHYPRESQAAILHYSIDVGIDFIGEGKQITSLPVLGALLALFNSVIGIALLRADQRASWMLWSVVPIVQTFLLVAFYLLWRVNVS